MGCGWISSCQKCEQSLWIAGKWTGKNARNLVTVSSLRFHVYLEPFLLFGQEGPLTVQWKWKRVRFPYGQTQKSWFTWKWGVRVGIGRGWIHTARTVEVCERGQRMRTKCEAAHSLRRMDEKHGSPERVLSSGDAIPPAAPRKRSIFCRCVAHQTRVDISICRTRRLAPRALDFSDEVEEFKEVEFFALWLSLLFRVTCHRRNRLVVRMNLL